MNYIKEAETLLWYYHDLHKSLENMQSKIGKLISSAGPRELTSVVLDETGVKSGRVDNTLNILYEIQVLTDGIKKTETELNNVNTILDELSKDPDCELFSKVLRMWYIERIPQDDIANELDYSRRSVFNIRSKAIRKLAVRLYGIDVLKAI